MTSPGKKPNKAKATQIKQKETTSMKTKLLKTIASSLLLACALVGLVAAMTLGTPRTAQAAAGARVCSVGMLNGLYLWTFEHEKTNLKHRCSSIRLAQLAAQKPAMDVKALTAMMKSDPMKSRRS